MPHFLHIGCGPKHKDQTTAGFNTPDWTEIRLDIDKVLAATLQAAGFASVASAQRGAPFFDLWALASKAERSEEALRALAAEHVPT